MSFIKTLVINELKRDQKPKGCCTCFANSDEIDGYFRRTQERSWVLGRIFGNNAYDYNFIPTQIDLNQK